MGAIERKREGRRPKKGMENGWIAMRGKYQSKRERERPEGGKELNVSSGGG